MFFTHSSCYAAVAYVFWYKQPCPVILLADRLWTALERLLHQHRAVPHWACQPGWLSDSVVNISPRCVRCSSAETGPFWKFCSFSLPQKTPSVGALVLTTSNTPALLCQHKSLCYINYSFILIEFSGNCASGQMESGNCHNRFLQLSARGWWSQDPLCKILKSLFCLFLFFLCCREISHLARADR